MTEAMEMVQAADDFNNKLSIVNQELRFLDTVQALRDVLEDGDIGALQRVQVNFEAGVADRFNKKFTWYHEMKLGGGILNQCGHHIFDTLSYVSGARVEKIKAEASLAEPGNTAIAEDDDKKLLCFFDDKKEKISSDGGWTMQCELSGSEGQTVQADIVLSDKCAGQKTFVFEGTDGTATLDLSAGHLSVVDASGAEIFQESDPVQEEDCKSVFQLAALQYTRAVHEATPALQEFIPLGSGGVVNLDDLLLGEAATFEDGLQTMAVLETVRECGDDANGEWLDVLYPTRAAPNKGGGVGAQGIPQKDSKQGFVDRSNHGL